MNVSFLRRFLPFVALLYCSCVHLKQSDIADPAVAVFEYMARSYSRPHKKERIVYVDASNVLFERLRLRLVDASEVTIYIWNRGDLSRLNVEDVLLKVDGVPVLRGLEKGDSVEVYGSYNWNGGRVINVYRVTYDGENWKVDSVENFLVT